MVNSMELEEDEVLEIIMRVPFDMLKYYAKCRKFTKLQIKLSYY